MQVQVSLLNKKMSEAHSKKEETFKIYIEDHLGNSYSTKVPSELSVEEAIEHAVANFNRDLQAGLPDDPALYELYPAKARRRDNGYPALEKGQPLKRVGKQRFCLVSLIRGGRFQSVTSLSSIRPIEMEFVTKTKE